jgi:hypothetical protein
MQHHAQLHALQGTEHTALSRRQQQRPSDGQPPPLPPRFSTAKQRTCKAAVDLHLALFLWESLEARVGVHLGKAGVHMVALLLLLLLRLLHAGRPLLRW